jgi:hypothetical protein
MKLMTVKSDGDIILKHVRLSYLYCFEPQTNVDDNGNTTKKFKVTCVLDKKEHKAEIAELQSILAARQKEKWKARLPADRLCLRDGDLAEKEELKGKWILVASEREDNPPATLDRDGKTRVKKSDDKLYSGAYGNVMIRFWDQDNPTSKGGKRINANFLGVQFVEHGDKFSSVTRPAEDEMFEDEGPGEEGAGFDDDGLD